MPSTRGSSSFDADGRASATVIDQASEWLVKFWSGAATPEDHQACARWRAAHTDHERAWQQLQTIEHKLGSVPRELAGMVLRAPSPARRRTLKALVALAVGGTATYTASRTALWQRYAADYHTSIGESKSLALADSTRVTLNTASAVDVRYNHQRRNVRLRGGEILVTTARDHAPNPRPFTVTTAQGLVQALGTRFSVRELDEGRSRVAVFHGAVTLQPNNSPEILTRLEAGQQADFSPTQVFERTAANEDSSAWTEGLIMAERMRLDEFLRELGRYRAGYLRCDPAVAALRFTGVYPLADPDHILVAIAKALPIQIVYQTRYWVTVTSR